MSCPNRGFTLLEIVLALAILAGAIAALGEVLRLAGESAEKAHQETQAQLLASAVMSELLAGARQMVAVSDVPFDLDTQPPWKHSIQIDSTSFDELVALRVRVAQQLPPEKRPVAVELVRWILNPDLVAELEASAPSSAAAATSSGGGA